MKPAIVITGTGSCVPEVRVPNSAFLDRHFLDEDGTPFPNPNEVIIEKFQNITEIAERRYARPDQTSKDLGAIAGHKALADAGWDAEDLDLLIVGQNFGDIEHGSKVMEQMPSIASRVKHEMGIENPNVVAFDVLAGCPGWIQGVLVAEAYLRGGLAKKALVIGCETLSRIVDVHDRDSMIFSDGAGAACFELQDAEEGTGIIGRAAVSYTKNEAYFLKSNPSNNPELDRTERLIKMKGRKIYEFAIRNVPDAMKAALDNAGVDLSEVKKIFMHQANAKLDHAVGERLYKLYGMKADLDAVMPMSIQWMGNSSVATVPTLLDMVRHENYQGHSIEKGDVVLFASVGAGMNINAFVYRF
ncbi:MAG: ketoacyl-ACP synthase III [Flavobacteriia bacterium]|jgi:3-oxoacyl-[acyl-carrier-protein] synthase-3|nr:ketoacyl-ACP synthase III [Flavobacteriia bacterium]NDD48042.1 ketoacyl-ACP synthase III [Flavobacteriia bacterium]NDD50194.1 ketoacyl-ACP synthase III [Flavobacteriia bacterium]